MAREKCSSSPKILLDYGPFHGYTDKSIPPLGDKRTTLRFAQKCPGSEWHLDSHCRSGITPMGLIWVVDCFRDASQWAAKSLSIKDIDGFDVAVDPITSKVYASGGESDYFSQVLGQSERILCNIDNFRDRWETFSKSIQHQTDQFCKVYNGLPLVKRLHAARMIQRHAWRGHFWFYFALRAHHWLIMKNILPTGVSMADVIEFLTKESINSRYEVCSDLLTDAAFECMVNIDPFYGQIYRRNLPASKTSTRHVCSDHNLKIVTRDIERLLDANYIWWSNEHHRYIEWIAGLPLYHTLSEAAKRLNLKFEDLCFCFYTELQNALEAGVVSDDLAETIVSRRKQFNSRSSSYSPPRVLSGESVYYNGTPLSSGSACGIPADRKVSIKGILVIDDLVPYENINYTNMLGIVTESRSELSHVAIAARQNGVPCVGGISPGDCGCLRYASSIAVNGDSGMITAWYSR